MPIEPPNPHKIVSQLREQLEALRQLIAAHPHEPDYVRAADHLEKALDALKSRSKYA